MVTASNEGGQASVSTASVGLVLPAAPADTIAPGIGGTAEQGDTLTAGAGVWNNGPTGYIYAWQDCSGQGTDCSAIGGATSSSYALSAADIGSTIVCVVTATGPGGSTPASTQEDRRRDRIPDSRRVAADHEQPAGHLGLARHQPECDVDRKCDGRRQQHGPLGERDI